MQTGGPALPARIGRSGDSSLHGSDFGDAFPSLNLQRMLMARGASWLPLGLIETFKGTMHAMAASGRPGGDETYLFPILPGAPGFGRGLLPVPGCLAFGLDRPYKVVPERGKKSNTHI